MVASVIDLATKACASSREMVIGMNPNDVSQLDDVGFSFFPVMVDYLTMVCVENGFIDR